jgi:hypothetical protein
MTVAEPQKIFCANHPDRETYLRCNRCDKPICTSCAVLTPTGYRCRECVKNQKKVFDTARSLDYPLAFVIAAGISFAGSELAGIFRFFTIFIAPIVGVVIAEAVRWVVKKRRSLLLYRITALATALGALPLLAISIISMVQFLSFGLGFSFANLWQLIWQAIYIFLVTSTVYYRLSGIELR